MCVYMFIVFSRCVYLQACISMCVCVAMLQLPETSAVSPIALVRMSGSMEKSTDVMKAMQSLIKVADIQQTMQALSREMTKVCLLEWYQWVSWCGTSG